MLDLYHPWTSVCVGGGGGKQTSFHPELSGVNVMNTSGIWTINLPYDGWSLRSLRGTQTYLYVVCALWAGTPAVISFLPHLHINPVLSIYVFVYSRMRLVFWATLSRRICSESILITIPGNFGLSLRRRMKIWSLLCRAPWKRFPLTTTCSVVGECRVMSAVYTCERWSCAS